MNWYKKAQWENKIKGDVPIPSSGNSVYIFRVVSIKELINIFKNNTVSGSFWASYLATPVFKDDYILVSETNGGNIRWRGFPPKELLNYLPTGEKNPEFIRHPTVKDHHFQQLKNRRANEIIIVLDSNKNRIDINELV